MDNLKRFLLDWISNYIKHKDVILKSIESVEENKDGFDLVITHKTKEHCYIVIPEIEGKEGVSDLLEKIDKEKHISLVVYNTQQSISTITDNWNMFIDLPFFSIYFVNPFSEGDSKWIVFPHVHNRVTEKESLKSGIKAMADAVGLITIAELNSLIKA